ncbi:MAG: QueT transporter family protein [Candidatus Bathyarchaeia archaeon]
MRTQESALTVTVASLYAVLTLALAPISFGPIQLRISDCLITLSALLGPPIVIGVTLGCFIGNLLFYVSGGAFIMSLGLVFDATLGPLANLVASLTLFKLRRRVRVAAFLAALEIGVIVGSYLWLIFPPPELTPGLPAWLYVIISVSLSSLISVAVLGYAILTLFKREALRKLLVGWGLKLYL